LTNPATKKKPKRGRPALPEDQRKETVSLRISADLLAKIDRYGAEQGIKLQITVTRSQTVEALIQRGLRAP